MPTATQSATQAQRAMLPMQTRAMPVSSYDPATNEFDCVWAAGAQVRRYDYRLGRHYLEELSMEPEHVDLTRLNSGAPLLDCHWAYSMEDQKGVVLDDTARIENSLGVARCKLSARDSVAGIRQDMEDQIIRNMSVGYSVRQYLVIEPPLGSDALPIYRAISWQPAELSLVPIGADPDAGVRSYVDARGANRVAPEFECEFVSTQASVLDAANTPQERSMPHAANSPAASHGPVTSQVAAPAATGTRTDDQIRTEAAQAERQRISDIHTAIRSANLDNAEALARGFIDNGTSIDAVRASVLDAMRERNSATEVRSAAHIVVVGDNATVHRNLMAEAIAHRVTPNVALSEGAREYRYMSLRELASASLELQGVRVRGMSPLELAARAMHTTSDFPQILANVMTKRLRDEYAAASPTYREWARRAPNAPDFKQVQVTQLGAMPDLKRLAEGGDIEYGTAGEGAEKYSVLTYARGIRFSRQMLINDDLRAFDRTAIGFSVAAARLENTLVYGQLIANQKLSDNVNLFHGSHGNLAATGAAIDIDSLRTGRAAMRKQKGLADEALNISPSFLLVGSDNEQAAYQYTSSNYVPATAGAVNEFRSGGRTAVTPIVDSVLDGSTAWYLAAEAGMVDTVEYCYLDGSEGVFLDSAADFDSDGMKVKARLDFAAKAIDFRGVYKNPGVAPT